MKKKAFNLPTILQHSLFIILILSLAYFFDPRPEFVKQNMLWNGQSTVIWVILVLLACFYLNMFLLVPKLLTNKNWGYYVLSIVAISVLIIALYYQFTDVVISISGRPVGPPKILFFLLLAFSVSAIIRLNSDRAKNERKRKDLEYESLKSELSLLRSQITPHFMFNVLNTLTSLARKKSDDLEDVIIRISHLMRYMLYNKSDSKIGIEQEVEFIESYLTIQQLRFDGYIKLNSFFEVDDVNQMLEPMLLIPLIENAFKHGSGSVEDPIIDLNLKVNSGILEFTIKNKYNQEVVSNDSMSGIGLNNVRKRLGFLYKDKYELNTETESGNFIARLKVEL
ncbi:MAG: histidine kinase [Bacteroidota bacterium]